jgi:hypothetical protein
MKTSLFAFVVFLLVHVVTVPGKKTAMVASDTTITSNFWEQDASVKVFFVRGMFTSEQRQALWGTLQNWKQEQATSLTTRFLNGGETGGLIDCLGCLTLTKETLTSKGKRQASFNRLRWDKTGRLVSAWIGFDRAITEPQKLTRLLARMLDAEELLRIGDRKDQ